MENLVLDGKKYVKASVIARELGYTSDYVGQLCRSGKVDATLVGRSWYVVEESLRRHKHTRYRSSKKTTARAVKETIEQQQTAQHDGTEVPINRVQSAESISSVPVKTHTESFYAHAPSKIVSAAYTDDDGDLLPPLHKEVKQKSVETEIEVGLADAEEVEVEEASKSYRLAATEPEKVHFHGHVVVSDADEEAESADAGDADAAAKPVSEAQEESSEQPKKKQAKATSFSPVGDEKTSKIKIKLNNRKHKKIPKSAVHEHNVDGVVSMRRALYDQISVEGGTLAMPALSVRKRVFIYAAVILPMIVLALAGAGLLVGLEGQVDSTPQTVSSSYSFSEPAVAHVLEALVTQKW